MRGQNQALGTPKGDTEGVEKGLKKAQKQQGRQRAPKMRFRQFRYGQIGAWEAVKLDSGSA